MPYEVIDLDTEESHGIYDTLSEARGCVQFDRLRAYAIWRGYHTRGIYGEDPEWVTEVRVECCDPYDGDDDRAKQGLGEPNDSEAWADECAGREQAEYDCER
jgi:hypothetical protein